MSKNKVHTTGDRLAHSCFHLSPCCLLLPCCPTWTTALHSTTRFCRGTQHCGYQALVLAIGLAYSAVSPNSDLVRLRSNVVDHTLGVLTGLTSLDLVLASPALPCYDPPDYSIMLPHTLVTCQADNVPYDNSRHHNRDKIQGVHSLYTRHTV
jgi:hypothetical protein